MLVTAHEDVIDFYLRYGLTSFSNDEPAYAAVCEQLGEFPELVALIAAHPKDEQQPNLLFAAVHYLILDGLDHPLADVYYGDSSEAAAPLFADLVLSNHEVIDELLSTRRTQTNEVGRCAILAPLLQQAESRAGKALAWIDLGASGGLNLNVDRYVIQYQRPSGPVAIGDSLSPVQLDCEIRSGTFDPPPDHATIGWRLGVDRSPVDVTDPDSARWLKACLWPSKVERMSRLDAAISLANGDYPVEIVHAEAADGLAEAISRAPEDLALVVTTSWVWYYFPDEVKAATLEIMRRCDRRMSWYSIEGSGVVGPLAQPDDPYGVESLIGLVEVGGGQPDRAEVLGRTHPHGAWTSWF